MRIKRMSDVQVKKSLRRANSLRKHSMEAFNEFKFLASELVDLFAQYVDIRKNIPAGEGLRGATMQREDVKKCYDRIRSILLDEILKEQMKIYGEEEE